MPSEAIPFENALKSKDHAKWVHFYQEDRKFECVWNNPQRYLLCLKKYSGVITPDYSLYREIPLAMQIWNTYRNRALAYWLQSNGVNIVPNVRWGDERTFAFAFEGLPLYGTVAVSTNGCIQDKLDRYYFCKGLDAMIEHLHPSTIVSYSQTPENIFGKWRRKGIRIIPIENYHITVRKELR